MLLSTQDKMNPENSPFINIELVRKEIGNLRPIEAYCNGFEKGRNQTLAQVEKIIDKYFEIDCECDTDYTLGRIRKEVKNLKEKHE